MTKEKVNKSTNLDNYLTKKFKGYRISYLNRFLLELYDSSAWRSCYFQKKPAEYKKSPDRFYLFTNSESMSSIVAKVNADKPLPICLEARDVIANVYKVIQDDMIIECIYSKPIFCNLSDDEAAIDLLETIINE